MRIERMIKTSKVALIIESHSVDARQPKTGYEIAALASSSAHRFQCDLRTPDFAFLNRLRLTPGVTTTSPPGDLRSKPKKYTSRATSLYLVP